MQGGGRGGKKEKEDDQSKQNHTCEGRGAWGGALLIKKEHLYRGEILKGSQPNIGREHRVVHRNLNQTFRRKKRPEGKKRGRKYMFGDIKEHNRWRGGEEHYSQKKQQRLLEK